MSNPAFIGLWLIPALLLTVAVHEFGHAVGGWAAGFVVTSFGSGMGRVVFVLKAGGVRFYWGLIRPLQGLTFAFMPSMQPSRLRLISYVLGGVVANAIFACVSLACVRWLPWGESFWLALAGMNGVMSVTNLIPFNHRVGNAWLRTDGALAIRALRSGNLTSSSAANIQTLDALRGLWTSIGDRRMLRLYLLNATASWIDLGNTSRAEALLREAEAMTDATHPYIEATEGLVRATLAVANELPDEANAAIAVCEDYYRATDQPVGLFLVNLTRANVRILEKDPAGAAAMLEALASDPIAKTHRNLGLGMLTSRLRLACEQSDADVVKELLGRYENDRGAAASPSRDLRVYAAVANFYAVQGDQERAKKAFLQALNAQRLVAHEWSTPGARAAYLEGQAAWVETVKQQLQAWEAAEEAETLIATAALPKPIDPGPENDRKYRRWALRIMLVNVIVFIFTIPMIAFLEHEWIRSIVMIPLSLGFFTGVAVLYLAFDLTIGRLVPILRRFSGLILLVLACIAWIGVLAAVQLWMFGPHSP